ncbi:MAG: SCO family protein [Pseudomonadota bacterium]
MLLSKKPITAYKKIVLLSLVATCFITACDKKPENQLPAWHGLDIANSIPTDSINAWKLASTLPNDEKVGLPHFRGKAVLLFFGFTQCPDICPTTLSTLARIHKQLGAESSKLQVIFVTVDPERDQLPLLKQYVTQFNPSFIALRGSLEETRDVTERFKVFFQKAQSSGTYSVDHSSSVFLIDKAGRVQALMPNNLSEKDALEDVKVLLKL